MLENPQLADLAQLVERLTARKPTPEEMKEAKVILAEKDMEKSKPLARKRPQPKYFSMEERDQGGGWSVTKKRNGFCLYGSELGLVGGGCKTISDALNCEGELFGGSNVSIDTNIGIEELLDIMNSQAFETLLNNLDRLSINHVEINTQSFKDFLTWYAKTRELKKSSQAMHRKSQDPH